MNRETNSKKLLLIGLIGAIITVIGGELPLGWYTNPDLPDRVMAQFAGYGSVSDLQLALGVFFGGIGIALQGLGYEGISKIIGTDPKLRHPSKIIHIGALACGSLGPLVHILAIAMMYVCRSGNQEEIMRFAGLMVAPITIVFMPIYMAMMVVMFVMIIRGKTVWSKGYAFVNPMIIMMVVNAVTFFGPNFPVVHSIQMANMGLGSLITFACLITKNAKCKA